MTNKQFVKTSLKETLDKIKALDNSKFPDTGELVLYLDLEKQEVDLRYDDEIQTRDGDTDNGGHSGNPFP